MNLVLNDKYLGDFIKDHEVAALEPASLKAHEQLMNKTGLGSDYLGWVDLPDNYDKDEFDRIKKAAKKIKEQSKVLIIIGIGGSYLGARAIIRILKSEFYNDLTEDTPKIYFLGNNISAEYTNKILKICDKNDFSVNVISKSGTTTEPALAFRLLKTKLEKKYGKEEASDRIYVTTDKSKGTLKQVADINNYESFVIPDDVGGRYSVLTAVGLLPIAASGVDIDKLMLGAKKAYDKFKVFSVEDNDAVKYAVLRNILDRKDKHTEILVSYDPEFSYFLEWYKQLFGESEGKDNKGIFPSSALFSTDLHSMGQYIQDGRRNIFETVLTIKNVDEDLSIEADGNDYDGLNYLIKNPMSLINKRAFQATLLAHSHGGVPNIILELEDKSEESIGFLIYFFEFACAISGYILGINPFDQPGVEAYKQNMFALLEKPGYEDLRKTLLKIL